MANNIKFPFINPLQFYKQTPDTQDKYRSRHFDDFYVDDTILPWEQHVDWEQPWQLSDNLHLQLMSNYGPINLRLYNDSDELIDTIAFSQGVPDYNDATLFIWEADVDMSGYTPGCYYFTISFGNPIAIVLQSEMINLAAEIENTLLLEYEHFEFREDMIFETGIAPKVRIPAVLKFKGPASKNTLYEDQSLNQEVIRAENFRLWNLSIGTTFGVPDYFADKLDRILGCSSLLIDGKYYAKNDGSISPNEIDNYPLRGWSIELREKLNRASRHYEDETAQNTTVSVLINVDSKGFGADTGGNETVIVDVE